MRSGGLRACWRRRGPPSTPPPPPTTATGHSTYQSGRAPPMSAATPTARLRVLTALLSLALLVTGAAPPAGAVHAPSIPAAPALSPDAQTDTARALQAMQEAYELLLDRYAIPLDPAELVNAAQEG